MPKIDLTDRFVATVKASSQDGLLRQQDNRVRAERNAERRQGMVRDVRLARRTASGLALALATTRQRPSLTHVAVPSRLVALSKFGIDPRDMSRQAREHDRGRPC